MEYYKEHRIKRIKYKNKFELSMALNPALIKDDRKLTEYSIRKHFIGNMNEKTRHYVLRKEFGTMEEIKQTLKRLETQRRAAIIYNPDGNHPKMQDSFVMDGGYQAQDGNNGHDLFMMDRGHQEPAGTKGNGYNRGGFRGGYLRGRYRGSAFLHGYGRGGHYGRGGYGRGGYYGRGGFGRGRRRTRYFRDLGKLGDKCWKCYNAGHKARDCKAKDLKCQQCGKEGHVKEVCWHNPESPCYRHVQNDSNVLKPNSKLNLHSGSQNLGSIYMSYKEEAPSNSERTKTDQLQKSLKLLKTSLKYKEKGRRETRAITTQSQSEVTKHENQLSTDKSDKKKPFQIDVPKPNNSKFPNKDQSIPEIQTSPIVTPNEFIPCFNENPYPTPPSTPKTKSTKNESDAPLPPKPSIIPNTTPKTLPRCPTRNTLQATNDGDHTSSWDESTIKPHKHAFTMDQQRKPMHERYPFNIQCKDQGCTYQQYETYPRHHPDCIVLKDRNEKHIEDDDEREIEREDIECNCEHIHNYRKQFDIEPASFRKSHNGECYVVNTLDVIDDRGRQFIRLKPVQLDHQISLLVDTGSTIGVCNERMWEKYKEHRVYSKVKEQIVGIGGTVTVSNYLTFTFIYGHRKIEEKFYVLEGLKHDFIASKQFMKLNGYVLQRIPPETRVYQHLGTKIRDPADADEVFWAKAGPTTEEDHDKGTEEVLFGVKLSKKARQTVKELFKDYQKDAKSNDKMGEFPDFEFEIRFHDESKHHKQKPFTLSAMQRNEMARQMNELLEIGRMRPSESDFASPAFLVYNPNKPDKKPRLVVDYRQINA